MKIDKAKVPVLLFVLLCCNIHSFAQQATWSSMHDIRQVIGLASYTTWETLKQDKGVTLSSRWLSFGDSLKTREISSHFIVNADLQHVIVNLTLPERQLAWNDGVRSLKLLNREGSTWITHTVYDIPYPLSQQDLVIKNVMITENQKTIILMSALPNYIAPISNVNRQQLYFGKWELRQLRNGTTEVKFSAISFSRSGIPRFVRDPIIQHKLLQSFIRLKELSSNAT